MDSYNKLKILTREFTQLLFDIDIIKNNCIEENKKENNLDTRLDNICACIKVKSKPIHNQIEKFKHTNNLEEIDNSIVISTLNKNIKPTELELAEFKQKYPISNNIIWYYWFDTEYRRSNNYAKSYFYANESILYKEKPNIRNICMNWNTFNAYGFTADSLLNCIKKAKEL